MGDPADRTLEGHRPCRRDTRMPESALRQVANPASEEAVIQRWDVERSPQEQIPQVHHQRSADSNRNCTQCLSHLHLFSSRGLDVGHQRLGGIARLTGFMRLWIPERIVKAQPCEDPADLRGRRTPCLGQEPAGVPCNRQLPQLPHGYERPRYDSAILAPGLHQLFRPEEEHGASGEDQVRPPAGCGNLAVKQPFTPLRPLEPDPEPEGGA